MLPEVSITRTASTLTEHKLSSAETVVGWWKKRLLKTGKNKKATLKIVKAFFMLFFTADLPIIKFIKLLFLFFLIGTLLFNFIFSLIPPDEDNRY